MWYNRCFKSAGVPSCRANMGAHQAVLLNSLESALPACLPFYKQIAPITPLESALTDPLQLIENTATLTAAKSALTDIPSVTSLDSALTKTGEGGGDPTPYPSLSIPLPPFPNFGLATRHQPLATVFNTLRTLLYLSNPQPLCFLPIPNSFQKTAGVGYPLFPLRNSALLCVLRVSALRFLALLPKPFALSLRQNPNLALLFSIACALFCTYGGGG
jgi:hypothetical protein